MSSYELLRGIFDSKAATPEAYVAENKAALSSAASDRRIKDYMTLVNAANDYIAAAVKRGPTLFVSRINNECARLYTSALGYDAALVEIANMNIDSAAINKALSAGREIIRKIEANLATLVSWKSADPNVTYTADVTRAAAVAANPILPNQATPGAATVLATKVAYNAALLNAKTYAPNSEVAKLAYMTAPTANAGTSNSGTTAAVVMPSDPGAGTPVVTPSGNTYVPPAASQQAEKNNNTLIITGIVAAAVALIALKG